MAVAEKKSFAGDAMRAPVSVISGVGPAKASAYAAMGVRTVGDLLLHYPRAYENRGDIRLLSEAAGIDGKAALLLTVATEVKRTRLRNRMTLLKFRAYDDSGTAEITFFNQDFLKDKFPLGVTFRFYGKVERVGNRYALSSPVYEDYDPICPPRDLVSVYRMTEGLSGKQIARDVSTALSLCAGVISDPLPLEIAQRHRLCARDYAIRNIHFPADYRALAAAKRRLVFDEFFTFALGIALSKEQNRPKGAPVCRDTGLSGFLSALPYKLTGAQSAAVSEIISDMKSDTPMNRMLVGDVGCGKTVCAAAAMYVAVRNGRQAVLMAPTEILARQHYLDLSELFGRLGIDVGLLIGATPAAEKRRIKAALASPDRSARLDVVIGTQALLSDGVEFAAPGLVVTDEQHRFGVNQRASLAGKNDKAHLLVMSATPIPRSMALIMYGDLDVSRIGEMPPGRQKVDTFAVDESYRPRLEAFIEKLVREGGQVYIVCPAVEETQTDEEGDIDIADVSIFGDVSSEEQISFERAEKTPLKAAVEYAGSLAARFPDFSVAFIHGKMKSADKERIMRDFADGKIQVLVSTTVIEVGVNVPNACLMIVENADRFGLSQLHQLRGRVGRGSRKSYCVLVSDAASPTAAVSTAGRRLHSLCRLYDGYAIAEQDLQMRGPGDFFRSTGEDAIRQSGGIKLKLAEMCDDSSLMRDAFAEAAELVSSDPGLASHKPLRDAVGSMFEVSGGTMN